jgi:ATP-binding cassette subfamily B protein RaxB
MRSEPQLNLGGRRTTPLIHQDEAAECGLACVAMVAAHYGYEIDMVSLRGHFPISIKGMSLRTLSRVAEALRLDSRALRADLSELDQITRPAILHWGFNHFVVLTGIRGRGENARYAIHDPASGSRWLGALELSKLFTGVALELTPSVTFAPRQERSRLSVWQLWSRAHGFVAAAIRIFILSVLIELFTLAAPFYLQIGIDSVVPASDLDLLAALALGFGGAALLGQITTTLRAWSVVGLSAELGYRLVVNLFRHMVRLPVAWYERRSVGDVITRFNSSQPIADLLSNGLVPAVVDGLMACVTLVVMLFYSPLLSAIAGGAVMVYVGLRLAFFGVLRARNISVIQAQAREQASLIETVRGIMPVRLFAREYDRLATWQNTRVAVVNAQIAVGRLQALFSSAGSTIMALEKIAFVYLAIRMNLSGAFSIGMITAFAAYKQQFTDAALNVVNRAIDYKMLDVQLNRISDIALNAPDPATTGFAGHAREIRSIELQDVHFRYGPGEPEVLAGVSMLIEAGTSVAIAGPSGGGKTTLLKIVLALLEPTAGRVLVNGQPLVQFGVAEYRSQIATVMQDDNLFAGSIAQNIGFFDPELDIERVEHAARSAGIHDDIAAFPMRYESLVGDMGSALSGGQKQRVLLARALYHRPQYLVVDEGTAHLDIVTERAVNAALSAMPLTRLIVAHRPETIASADKRVFLVGGRIYNEPSKNISKNYPESQEIL